MDEILSVEHLTFDYSDASVLRDVTFTLHKGDYLGIIGANGAGKSTLIKLILGMLPYNNGTIRLFGGDLKSARTRIGYVAQKANSFNSDFPATVKEVVAANLYSQAGLFKRIGKKYDAKIKRALALVGMEDYENRLIGRLSGGQQQRVFVARALVNEPELLLMDEPTVGIDAQSAKALMELISELNRSGITIIMTNHDTPSLVQASNKLLIFCEHGYEEFVTRSDLSLDEVNEIFAGKRRHHHG